MLFSFLCYLSLSSAMWPVFPQCGRFWSNSERFWQRKTPTIILGSQLWLRKHRKDRYWLLFLDFDHEDSQWFLFFDGIKTASCQWSSTIGKHLYPLLADHPAAIDWSFCWLYDHYKTWTILPSSTVIISMSVTCSPLNAVCDRFFEADIMKSPSLYNRNNCQDQSSSTAFWSSN